MRWELTEIDLRDMVSRVVHPVKLFLVASCEAGHGEGLPQTRRSLPVDHRPWLDTHLFELAF